MHTLTGRRSTSLRALAEQQANERHTRRLAELHTLAPLLERLEAVVPALQAAGLTISPRDIYLARHHPNGPAGRALRAVRINTRPLCGDKTIPQRWLDVLLAQGFREIHRESFDQYPLATLQRGHLILKVDAPTPAASAAAAAAAKVEHQRRAEDAFADVLPC